MASIQADPQTSRPAVAATGLATAGAIARRREFGDNSLPMEKPLSAWSILLGQFNTPLIYIILAAAAISRVLAGRNAAPQAPRGGDT